MAREERDGDREFHHLGGAFEPAHDEPLGGRAEHGAQQQQDDGERHWCRPTPGETELPVRERGEHARGAVGQVEDPRRRVGHDEPTGDDRVDRAGRQTDDRERQESIDVDECQHGRSELPGDLGSVGTVGIERRHRVTEVTGDLDTAW
jgi:hypothetical protein